MMSELQGTYEGKTAQEWRAEAEYCKDQADKSWQRSDTDGYLSQWALSKTAQKYEQCAQLAEMNGEAEFTALFTDSGELLNAKYVDGTYGYSWRIQRAYGIVDWFRESRAKKAVTRFNKDTAKGYRLGTIRAKAIVKAGGDKVCLYYYFARDTTAPVTVIDDGSQMTQYQTNY